MSESTNGGSPWPLRMVVTLCGSTRFKTEFEHVTRELTLGGVIVLGPGVFGHADRIPLTTGQKAALDALHLAKIRRCDAVLVVNPRGYLGESTRAEIAYATRRGVPVAYTHQIAGWAVDCQTCAAIDDSAYWEAPTEAEATTLAGTHDDRRHHGQPYADVTPFWEATSPFSADLFTTPPAAPSGTATL